MASYDSAAKVWMVYAGGNPQRFIGSATTLRSATRVAQEWLTDMAAPDLTAA